MAQRTEDEWLERFGGEVASPEGSNIWNPSGETLEAVRKADPNTVWSVIEGSDSENLYLVPGFHVVNLVGYVISEKPITREEIASGEWNEVLWVDGNDLVRSHGR
jgi:hypothetical protein